MRRPSLFVRVLVVLTGVVFVLSSLLMRQLEAAIGLFIFFLVCWALLHSIGQNPMVKDSPAWRYWRLIILMGMVCVPVGIYFFVEALVNGQFATALHRLAALMLIVGPAWRYRKECVACLRHGEQQ